MGRYAKREIIRNDKEGKIYQTLPTETRFAFAKAKVEVQMHLDKTIHIFYKGQELPHKLIVLQKDKRYAPHQMETLAVGV